MITLEELLDRTWKDGDCLIWGGSIRNGYGQITTRGHPWGQEHRVHRLVKQLILGRKLEPKELVCHTCDRKDCINPDHLYVGTAKDNTRDIYARGSPHTQLGASWSEESKARHSASRKGEGNPFHGRKHSEETKQKMRDNHWRRNETTN